MARTHARLLTSIWSDDDFRTLSRDEQRVYILALSQPNLNLCGVVPYTAKRWALLAADTTPKAVSTSVNRLVKRKYLVLDDHTEEVLIRTFVKHDGVLRSPNLIVAMSRDYTAIQSADIRKAFREGLPEGFPEGLRKGFVEGFREPLPEGFWQRLAEPFREEILEPSPRTRAERVRGEPPPLVPPSPSPPAERVAEHHAPEKPSRPAAPPHGDDETKTHDRRIPAGSDDQATIPADAAHEINPPPVTTEAGLWARLAHHDLDSAIAAGVVVRARSAWLAKAARTRREAHGDDLDEWVAAGLTIEAFAAKLLDAETAGEPPHDGERRPPSWEETQARQQAQDAELAAGAEAAARIDAQLEALDPVDLQVLEVRARNELGGGRWPAAAVRAEMRRLHVASATGAEVS